MRGLFVLFVVLSIFDVVGTYLVVGNDPTKEWNPVAQMIISDQGVVGLVKFKCCLLFIIGGSLWAVHRKKPTVARQVLGFGIALMLVLSLYHVYLLAITFT